MGTPDLTAEEVVAEYTNGRRDFSRLNLEGLCLSFDELDDVSFGYSSLVGAEFTGFRLRQVSFRDADCTGATIDVAFVDGANFLGASLAEARLTDAIVVGGFFADTECERASMRGVDFLRTTFDGAVLAGVDFDGATIGHSSFIDVDVGPLCSAPSLNHAGPCTIDVRTVMRSYRHHGLKTFMIKCGVPEIFAEYMIEVAKAVGGQGVSKLLQSTFVRFGGRDEGFAISDLMQSTFISYGGPDEDFARRLYEALRGHGVGTFFFPETAKVGERIGDEVFNALQRHDRMILVCSRASLDRPGVLNEIQETLDREARDGGATYLIPVMLDDYLLDEWSDIQPVLATRVKSRVAADFRAPAAFDASLDRLLGALRKNSAR
ncbi:MAG TPA: toll/interleukin-1 receptor domain-containing protein [Actinomycetota bacterium]|nr:toll/interleukin-1 receptor domain-containing protein [Actinomycetota bacterium]